VRHLRIFLSFSGKDNRFIRCLLARLSALRLEPWDYSSEGQELPGGSNISRSLEDRITKSEIFLPIISPNSFASRYCREEVNYALHYNQKDHLQIIPIVSSSCPEAGTDWPEPYRQLARIIHYRVHFASPGSLERALKRLCDDFHVPYMPPILGDARLPFMKRFHDELQSKIPHRKGREGRENSVYRRLMQVQQEFEVAVKARDYPKALERIQFIIISCEHEFPRTPFYYPYIVKGVCEICMGRMIEATETLKRITSHPLLDENAFGAMGYIKYQQGAYHDAMLYYREASRRDPADAAALYGEVMNAILCGEPIDVDLVFSKLEHSRIQVPDDRCKIKTLKALALAYSHRLQEAKQLFLTLINDARVEPETLINFAGVLIDLGEEKEALTMLKSFESRFSDSTAFLYYLTQLSSELGEISNSLHYLDILTMRHPKDRKYWITKAILLWRVDNHAEAQKVAAEVLNSRNFSLPETADDFYYDGFANWILQHPELADYDFSRSGKPPDDHYSHHLSLSRIHKHSSLDIPCQRGPQS
jgi:tetratricopeptide (TPR) repeat protein